MMIFRQKLNLPFLFVLLNILLSPARGQALLPPNLVSFPEVAVVVDSGIAEEIGAELDRLENDLRAEGWRPVRYDWPQAGFSANNQGLHDFLRTVYDAPGKRLAGVFLIGDLPVGPSISSNTSDTPYWFLDRPWSEIAGLAWHQIPQSALPTNWVSRLYQSDPSGTYGGTALLVRRMLDANHLVRTGQARLPHRIMGYLGSGFTNNHNSPPAMNSQLHNVNLRWAKQRLDFVMVPHLTHHRLPEAYRLGSVATQPFAHGGREVFADMNMRHALSQPIMTFFHDHAGCEKSINAFYASHLATRGGLMVHHRGNNSNNQRRSYYAMFDGLPFGEATLRHRDISFSSNQIGDVTISAIPHAHNEMPKLTRIDFRAGLVLLPGDSVPFSADAEDPDGAIRLMEWFPEGFQYGLGPVLPSVDGEAQHTYLQPGRFIPRVDAVDEAWARVFSDDHPAIVVQPAPGQPVRINLGRQLDIDPAASASAYQHTDAEGRLWLSDLSQSAHSYGYSGNTSGSRPNPLSGDPELYSATRGPSHATNPMVYRVPLASGHYRVVLGMIDGSTNSSQIRTINATINGQPWLSDFNVRTEAGGSQRAVEVESEVVVDNGWLEMSFTRGASATHSPIVLASLSVEPLNAVHPLLHPGPTYALVRSGQSLNLRGAWLPGSGGSLAAWSVVSTPAGGSVVFDDPALPSTSAQFTGAGTYVLRLSGTDADGNPLVADKTVMAVAGGPSVGATTYSSNFILENRHFPLRSSPSNLGPEPYQVHWNLESGVGTDIQSPGAATTFLLTDGTGTSSARVTVTQAGNQATRTLSFNHVAAVTKPVVIGPRNPIVDLAGQASVDIPLALEEIRHPRLTPDDFYVDRWDELSTNPPGLSVVSWNGTQGLVRATAPGLYGVRVWVNQTGQALGEHTEIHTIFVEVVNGTEWNRPPEVDAGPAPAGVQAGQWAALQGSASDDGIVYDLQHTYWRGTGPGTVEFVDPFSPATQVRFSQPGTYHLRLLASDGQYRPVSDVTVVVEGTGTGTAPEITQQPQSLTVSAGQNVQFSVAATGDPAPSYQWWKDGAPLSNGGRISGVLSATLNIQQAEAGDAGNYHVVVSNVAETVTSSTAVLTVEDVPLPPTILTQPQGGTFLTGDSLVLEVTAAGTAPLTYQWRKDGVDIPGALSAQFTIASLSPSDSGSYSVVVTNAHDFDTSADAVVVVNAPVLASFASQPTGGFFDADETVVLSASLSGGSEPVTLRWHKDGVPLDNDGFIFGADTAELTIINVRVSDAGAYTLVATNAAGDVSSDPAVVEVNTPPVIQVLRPLGAEGAVPLGTGAWLAVNVTDDGIGPGEMTYAWSRPGGPGGFAFTDPDAASTGVFLDAAGEHLLRLTVSDANGMTAMQEITIRMVEPGDPAPGEPVEVQLAWGGDYVTSNQNLALTATSPAANTVEGYGAGDADFYTGDAFTTPRLDALRALPFQTGSILPASGYSGPPVFGGVEIWNTARNGSNGNSGGDMRVNNSGTSDTLFFRTVGNAHEYHRMHGSLFLPAEEAFAINDSFAFAAETANLSGGALVRFALYTADGQILVSEKSTDAAGSFVLSAEDSLTRWARLGEGGPSGSRPDQFAAVAHGGLAAWHSGALDYAQAFDAPEGVVGLGLYFESVSPPNQRATVEITSFSITGTAGGSGPTGNVGPAISLHLPATGAAGEEVAINATVHDADDGPEALTVTWSRPAGPGTAAFGDTAATSTTVSFDTAGAQLLRLIADDGAVATFAQAAVEVGGAGDPAFQAWLDTHWPAGDPPAHVVKRNRTLTLEQAHVLGLDPHDADADLALTLENGGLLRVQAVPGRRYQLWAKTALDDTEEPWVPVSGLLPPGPDGWVDIPLTSPDATRFYRVHVTLESE